MKFKVGQYFKVEKYNLVGKIIKVNGIKISYKILQEEQFGLFHDCEDWFHKGSIFAKEWLEILTKDEAIMELL